MNHLLSCLPNIVTGVSLGFSLGSCFFLYKFYEDYKKQLMYKALTQKGIEVGKAVGLSYALYLMFRGKLSKEIVKLIITKYYEDHPNKNEILILIDTLATNTGNIFGNPLFGGAQVFPYVDPIVPGPGSPFYNHVYDNMNPKDEPVKATGLNFTTKKNKLSKVSKKVKKSGKNNDNDLTDSESSSSDDLCCQSCKYEISGECLCSNKDSLQNHIQVDI